MSEEKNILNGGADVASDPFEPRQIISGKASGAVEEEKTSSGLAALVEGDRHHGAQTEQLLRRTGETRKRLERAAVAAIPSEARTCPNQTVPTDGGVEVVEEQAVGAREGEIFGNETLTFAGLQTPEKDALEIDITVDEQGFMGLEGLGELVEEQAKRFGETLLDLHGAGEAGEEVVLDGELAVAVAEESQAGAGSESGSDQADPGDNADPLDVALYGGQQTEFEGQQSGQRKR